MKPIIEITLGDPIVLEIVVKSLTDKSVYNRVIQRLN
jgi:hypothetical protein